MNWKNWPYWLRGGVIGGGTMLVSSILSISCLLFFASPGSWGLECLPFAFPAIPVIYTLLLFPGAYSLSSEALLLIEVAIYFIFGSFIGILISYMNSKKKKTDVAN